MQLHLRLSYPNDDKYETKLERINLDEEMLNDMAKGKGFLIKDPPPLNKALSRTDSIYSERFMKTLQDPDAFSDRYSCKCGLTQGRDYKDMICPHCHTKVRFVGDDFEIFGYIVIKDDYHIIHPNMFKTLAKYFGPSTFESIIEPEIDLDENGNPVNKYTDGYAYKKQQKRKYSKKQTKVDDTYAGTGMMAFYDKFDEILEYYHTKFKGKKEDYYNDIIANRDLIFIHSIPVYSTGLRPFKVEGDRFTFEGTNALFNIMAKLAWSINNDSLSIYRNEKYRNSLLYQLQDRYNTLYGEIEKILANKKGMIQNLIGRRCGFTSRSIIVPDPKLRSDEIKLSYHTLIELLQQTIINILVKTYNIGYADAYMRFFHAQLVPDKRIYNIIENLIKMYDGIPMLVNRNPTINYGSIMALRCIGISEGPDNYTMCMPLRILSPFAADFDGDCLTIMHVPNKEFWESALECFNPRNAMLVSHNDGKFNGQLNVFKDTIINANGMINISRGNYSAQQLSQIQRVKQKWTDIQKQRDAIEITE